MGMRGLLVVGKRNRRFGREDVMFSTFSTFGQIHDLGGDRSSSFSWKRRTVDNAIESLKPMSKKAMTPR